MRRASRLARALIVNMIDQRIHKLTPEFMTYTIAKMGLWALTRTAAQALAPQIRVNAIGPGPTLQGARQSRATSPASARQPCSTRREPRRHHRRAGVLPGQPRP
jgi:NAD(P)-dependent dehydrogenase (short-subunit alcohol dehydrogenase family)